MGRDGTYVFIVPSPIMVIGVVKPGPWSRELGYVLKLNTFPSFFHAAAQEKARVDHWTVLKGLDRCISFRTLRCATSFCVRIFDAFFQRVRLGLLTNSASVVVLLRYV